MPQYTPPTNGVVNFTVQEYTPPTNGVANFSLEDSQIQVSPTATFGASGQNLFSLSQSPITGNFITLTPL